MDHICSRIIKQLDEFQVIGLAATAVGFEIAGAADFAPDTTTVRISHRGQRGNIMARRYWYGLHHSVGFHTHPRRPYPESAPSYETLTVVPSPPDLIAVAESTIGFIRATGHWQQIPEMVISEHGVFVFSVRLETIISEMEHSEVSAQFRKRVTREFKVTLHVLSQLPPDIAMPEMLRALYTIGFDCRFVPFPPPSLVVRGRAHNLRGQLRHLRNDPLTVVTLRAGYPFRPSPREPLPMSSVTPFLNEETPRVPRRWPSRRAVLDRGDKRQ